MPKEFCAAHASRPSPTLEISTSPTPLRGTAAGKKSTNDAPESETAASKGPRPRFSFGDITKHFRRPSQGAASPLDNFIEKNPELEPFRDDLRQQWQAAGLDESMKRTFGKARSRGETQYLRRMSVTQLPAPLRIKDKEVSNVVERIKRKAREAFPQRRKSSEDQTPVHRHIARLIQETKVEYANLGARTLSRDDRRPCCPSAWMRVRSSSLPTDWRPLSPLNPEWSPETASRRSSCPGARKRPAVAVGVSESSAASAIRGGMRPVYSNNSSRASSFEDSGMGKSSNAVPEPLRLTSKPESANTVVDQARKDRDDRKVRHDVYEEPAPTMVARKGSMLNFMKIFESGSSKRLSRFGSHHGNEREGRSLKRCSGQEAKTEQVPIEEQVRQASRGKAPILQIKGRDGDDYPVEDWSRRLSRVLEVYTPADQEKMVREPAFSTVPEVVRITPYQPQSTYGEYLPSSGMVAVTQCCNDTGAVRTLLDTSVTHTHTTSALSSEGVSPMTRLEPQELEAPVAVYELADTSDSASIGGESFETAREWGGENEDAVLQGAAAGKRAHRLDSGMAATDEVRPSL